MKFTIELTEQQVNIVLQSLAKMPLEQVIETFTEIKQQAEKQLQDMKEFFEKSMSEASEKIKDLLDVKSSRFNKDVVELHGITDLKFNNDNIEIIKSFNHKYQGLVDIYPDEKIWLQTISKDKSL